MAAALAKLLDGGSEVPCEEEEEDEGWQAHQDVINHDSVVEVGGNEVRAEVVSAHWESDDQPMANPSCGGYLTSGCSSH